MKTYRLYVVEFPFAEKPGMKFRPVVALTQLVGPYKLLLVAYITSRALKQPLASDVVLDWEKAGLKRTSVVQLHKIVSVPQTALCSELGVLTLEDSQQLQQHLRQLLEI